ncbi:unnamed protein product [Tilletia controversa]|uniref:Pre-mRNA-splicing factor 18 n=3 Tax=Tilletia TaxID=13289 RepID=A0A8X7MTS0_9BASI|nr:hypothetical protein CF336_g2434 [Tilletia laevis]KAE8199929.1 hypothetical protein CF328_g3106 [Tilletia controversa]KAE8263182.1 hypothetical protein A4X03_0g1869 [Tilletia caries]KAE8206792.1 hypothetical protein CF335_g1611 [Tilletia laevis]KAE8248132.1 hypothetical protein A4X06_0g3936 [Tilletia controversa]
MEALRAGLEAAKAKRRPASTEETSNINSNGSSAKYVRRKDLEQPAPPQPAAKRQRVSSPAAAATSASTTSSTATSGKDAVALNEAAKDALALAIAETTEQAQPTLFNISPEEAIRRLRAKNQPIRLFGESDKDRRLRLRALELLEERGGGAMSSLGGQNDFMRALAKAGQDHRDREAEENSGGRAAAVTAAGAGSGEGSSTPLRGATGEGGQSGTPEPSGAGPGDVGTSSSAAPASSSSSSKPKEGIGMDQVLDLTLLKREPNKLYPIIYYTLKGLLRDWEQALSSRPEDLRRSTQGRLAAATQVQAAEYLQPLFKLLRKRSLAPDVLARLSEIVHFVQKREYRHANDAYLQLSIGNAPWPIGVTMVGIHERSGREKIFSSNVAHVLNDEVSRKYIQSLKRLMTFAQTKYPPASTAMLMG